MHRLLCLAVLMGCASTTPERSELHRGTFAPPPPAPARPGVGLPTYDPQVNPLPPQPNPKPARLLPQTPETARQPGIWATKSPEQEEYERWSADREREPLVLGVHLRYPPGTIHEEESRPTNLCAAKIDRLLRVLMSPDQISKLNPKERTCLAYRMYGLCASEDVWPNTKQPKRWPEPSALWRHNVWNAATTWAKDECPPDAATKAVQDAFDAAKAKWGDAQ